MRRTILRLQGNLTAIEKCRVPVLAAIHNTCIGGGVDMTCCADMRYATEDAYFSIREIDIGMTADVGTLQRLPKIIPDGVVRELAYTGRNMDAEEAREVGFVNRVFEDRDTMLREVTALARSIAKKSPLAMRGSKEMLLYSGTTLLLRVLTTSLPGTQACYARPICRPVCRRRWQKPRRFTKIKSVRFCPEIF